MSAGRRARKLVFISRRAGAWFVKSQDLKIEVQFWNNHKIDEAVLSGLGAARMFTSVNYGEN